MHVLSCMTPLSLSS